MKKRLGFLLMVLWGQGSTAQIPSSILASQEATTYLGKLMGEADVVALNTKKAFTQKCEQLLPHPTALGKTLTCQVTFDARQHFRIEGTFQKTPFVINSALLDMKNLREARNKAIDATVKFYVSQVVLQLEVLRSEQGEASLQKWQGNCQHLPDLRTPPKEIRSCQITVSKDGQHYQVTVTGINGSQGTQGSETYQFQLKTAR